jgi:hypothetical protein
MKLRGRASDVKYRPTMDARRPCPRRRVCWAFVSLSSESDSSSAAALRAASATDKALAGADPPVVDADLAGPLEAVDGLAFAGVEAVRLPARPLFAASPISLMGGYHGHVFS